MENENKFYAGFAEKQPEIITERTNVKTCLELGKAGTGMGFLTKAEMINNLTDVTIDSEQDSK